VIVAAMMPNGSRVTERKIKHTSGELAQILEDLLAEIEAACERFDKGHDAPAKTLAGMIRVLVHDTKSSHSLLKQLGRKAELFVDSMQPPDPHEVSGTYHGLAALVVPFPRVTLRRDYAAMLDDATSGQPPRIPFEDWWRAVVFRSKEMGPLTRRDLILTVANEHGGAHVDPDGLSESYAKLAKLNALGCRSIPRP
jgi:hypothetical protein